MNGKTSIAGSGFLNAPGVRVVYEMTDEHLEALADKLALRMGLLAVNKPLTVAQVAKLLGVSGEAIRQRVKAGKIPKLPGFGKRVLISRETVERLQRGESVQRKEESR